jgi:hypothetical protein
MNFYLEIDKINDISKLEINVISKDKNLLFKKFYKNISIEKEKIDLLENSENWDKMKKIGNPYELIFTTYNKKRKNDSISKYIPISRSYFKMWEIFNKFDLFKHFNINDKFVFSHLAEGPGGFMEASYNYRSNLLKKKIIFIRFISCQIRVQNNFLPKLNASICITQVSTLAYAIFYAICSCLYRK